MNKSKFTDKEIHFVLEQVEKGALIKDICTIMNISRSTFYSWKYKYSKKNVDSKKIKSLEDRVQVLSAKVRQLEEDKRILLSEIKRLNIL